MSTQTYEIGQTILDTKTEQVGTIVAIAKGWYTVELEDGEEIKRRAADLEAYEGETLDEEPEEEDEETIGGTMSKKLRRYAQNYAKAKTTKGKPTKHCGDFTASLMVGLTLDQVYQLAARITEGTPETLRQRYGHLNLGQQRMNLGNRIRGALKRFEEEDPKSAASVRDSATSWVNSARVITQSETRTAA